jgi:hypothetical protein
MKKLLRYKGIIFLTLFGIMIVFIIVSFINHQKQIARENKWYAPVGQLVEINGHQMSVYTEIKWRLASF